MQLHATEIAGCHLVDLDLRSDARGFFARAWCVDELAGAGVEAGIVQLNDAFSNLAGTTRGLHWQEAPHGEQKFVRCIRGAVFDVCVDIRPDSPTFGRWVGAELTADNRRALIVPSGCAHGYQTLVDNTELLYASSERYAPDAERGARYDDPLFAVDWPLSAAVLSDKDAGWPDFAKSDR